MDPMTIEELTEHVGIDTSVLDQRCSEDHLRKLAKKIRNWEQYAKPLGLSDQDIQEIKTDNNLDYEMKTVRVLEKWAIFNGFKATYKSLVRICLEQRNAVLAEEVCKLVKAGEGTPTPPTTTVTAGTGTHAVLVSRLRDVLGPMRNTPDTPSKAEYIKEYVLSNTTTLLQSGVGHGLNDLKQQLYKLHKEELLFSEDVLKQALALAEEEHSKRTEAVTATPTATKPVAKEPLFSKDTVYHSDICCRVLAKGDAGNYQSLFKKLPNGQGHSFKAVSMSRSKTERLLISKQGESVFYFAFESRPLISDWKEYKSFDEGVMIQSQQFPIRYIVELLNKQCRIVITGFSFGGLLASTVTALVWNLPYISTDLLKDNLTCITFGKPLVSVRVIQSVTQRRPEITSTIHSVYSEGDHVPYLMSYLDESWAAKELSKADGGSVGGIQLAVAHSLDAPFQDQVTSSLLENFQKLQTSTTDSAEVLKQLQSKLEELKPKLSLRPDPPETSHNISCVPGTGLVWTEHHKPAVNVSTGRIITVESFKQHSMDEYSRSIFDSYLDKEPKFLFPLPSKHAPLELVNLIPTVKEVHVHRHGGQTAIVVEGSDMWFCRELSLLGYSQKVSAHDISGSSIQFNVNSGKEPDKPQGHDQPHQKETVVVYSQFSSKPNKQTANVHKKGYGVTSRQEQLAKLTPSQVIELAYLSALLEQHPNSTTSVLSHKCEVITKFLRDVVKVVPFESIVYAIAFSSYETALVCYKALASCGIEPPATEVMQRGLLVAGNRMRDGVPPQSLIEHFRRGYKESSLRLSTTRRGILTTIDDENHMLKLTTFSRIPGSSLYDVHSPIHESTIPVNKVTKHSETVGTHLAKMNEMVSQSIDKDLIQAPICSDINIDLLYPVTTSQSDSDNSLVLKSPIDILVKGREELRKLARGETSASTVHTHCQVESNQRMLDTVNTIRKTELEVCTSLLGGFMEQQDIDIALVKSRRDRTFAVGLTATATIGVWALFSLDYSQVQPILAQCDGEKLLVKILDYVKTISGVSPDSDDSSNTSYAAKLQFMVQGMTKTVTCNTQYVGYSLERQLVELCQKRNIEASIPLSDLLNKWGQLFKNNTLSLVDHEYRSLIGRWLKWALMVHNLREELARYTAVGVTGLVNSGKSKLINTLFGIKAPVGTTESKRTTVPFLYNLDECVEGLNVVDFPGVDDEDDTIGDLADLLITVAQIILFVVDYRRAHTQSAKKWLERLHKENVPVLVCLTFGDRLYAEYIKKGVHPDRDTMKAIVKDQLSVTEAKLRPTGTHKVSFFSFAQENDSLLVLEDGQKKLRDVGIGSPLQVGEWLLEVFKKDFDNEKLADKLEPFMQENAKSV